MIHKQKYHFHGLPEEILHLEKQHFGFFESLVHEYFRQPSKYIQYHCLDLHAGRIKNGFVFGKKSLVQ